MWVIWGGRYSTRQHPQNDIASSEVRRSLVIHWTVLDLHRLGRNAVHGQRTRGSPPPFPPQAPKVKKGRGWGSPVTRPPAGVHTPVWAFTAVLEDDKKPVNPPRLRGEPPGLTQGLTFHET